MYLYLFVIVFVQIKLHFVEQATHSRTTASSMVSRGGQEVVVDCTHNY
jgi:hypothetical protein